MSDLKKFLDKKLFEINEETSIKVIDINDLGLFFWNKGGKWFVRNELIKDLEPELNLYKYLIRIANECVSDDTNVVLNYSFKAKDFLDCLAYLGKDKVKELIKECERINE